MSAGVVPLASAACGLAQLEGRRSQACRCSRGRRSSESDSEPRDRLGGPPQRHPSGVGDPLTQTPLRRACRPQRPSSPLIAQAHRGPTPPEARYHRPSPCTVAWCYRRDTAKRLSRSVHAWHARTELNAACLCPARLSPVGTAVGSRAPASSAPWPGRFACRPRRSKGTGCRCRDRARGRRGRRRSARHP
jgi:hypothetical protein